MAILDGVIDEANYEPILGSSEEELRRRAARGPLRTGSILGAQNFEVPQRDPMTGKYPGTREPGLSALDAPILEGGPILGSSVTPRPKLTALNEGGSPYARMTGTDSPAGTAEQARNTPILGVDSDTVRPLRPGTRGYDLAAPRILAPRQADVTPPILGQPEFPSAGILGGAARPAEPVRPLEPEGTGILGRADHSPFPGPPLRSDAAFQPRKMPTWEKILGLASSFAVGLGTGQPKLAGELASGVLGAPRAEAERRYAQAMEDYNAEQGRQKAAEQEQFATPAKRQAYMQANPGLFEGVSQFERNDFILTGKFPQREPAPEKQTDKKIDEYVDAQGRRVLTFQKPNGEVYDRVGATTQPRSSGHTSPFEAFAYGTPEEKKAAQDFLSFEKRMGSQYQRPTEAEFRYSLYKRDPEGYKAVFGDKAAAGDRAHASRMLNFFQRQRDAISKNFMLGDDEKAQQLQEIDDMEKPFMETARGNSGGGDRVNVVSPDGIPGTIPRSQLGAARRKGYRVAQ